MEFFACACCGQQHPVSDRFIFDSRELCYDCFRSQTALCVYCGERIWIRDDHGGVDHTVCPKCAVLYRSKGITNCFPKSTVHKCRLAMVLTHITVKLSLRLTISLN